MATAPPQHSAAGPRKCSASSSHTSSKPSWWKALLSTKFASSARSSSPQRPALSCIARAWKRQFPSPGTSTRTPRKTLSLAQGLARRSVGRGRGSGSHANVLRARPIECARRSEQPTTRPAREKPEGGAKAKARESCKRLSVASHKFFREARQATHLLPAPAPSKTSQLHLKNRPRSKTGSCASFFQLAPSKCGAVLGRGRFLGRSSSTCEGAATTEKLTRQSPGSRRRASALGLQASQKAQKALFRARSPSCRRGRVVTRARKNARLFVQHEEAVVARAKGRNIRTEGQGGLPKAGPSNQNRAARTSPADEKELDGGIVHGILRSLAACKSGGFSFLVFPPTCPLSRGRQKGKPLQTAANANSATARSIGASKTKLARDVPERQRKLFHLVFPASFEVDEGDPPIEGGVKGPLAGRPLF